MVVGPCILPFSSCYIGHDMPILCFVLHQFDSSPALVGCAYFVPIWVGPFSGPSTWHDTPILHHHLESSPALGQKYSSCFCVGLYCFSLSLPLGATLKMVIISNMNINIKSLLPGDQGNCVVLCLAKSCCQAEIEDGEATAGFPDIC